MALGARQSKSGRRSNRGAVTLLIVLVLVGFGLIAQTAPQVRERFNPVRTAMGDRLSRTTSNDEPGFIAHLTGEAGNVRRIRALEAEVRELARYKAAAISMAERLETYEEMLNLLGEGDVQGVTARVVAETDGPFERTLLANAGTRQGVEPGSVAVNEGGLVGRVVLIGDHSARVLQVTDFNSRVPVVGEVSGLRAIVRGGNNNLGVLVDLPEAAEFTEGERILTSGEGGAFPRGLVVGEARKIDKEWRLRFAMQTGRGGYVRILPPRLIETPLGEPMLPQLPPLNSAKPIRPAISEVTPLASNTATLPNGASANPRPRPRPQPAPEAAAPSVILPAPAPVIVPTPAPETPPPANWPPPVNDTTGDGDGVPQ